MARTIISSGTVWEESVGYCRAVRVGNIIEVAGTTAVDEHGTIMGTTVYEQTRFILQKIDKALVAAGANMTDVVRTRMFITDIAQWEEAGRAHGEVFRDIKPASTMVEVSRLIGDDLLIEIEVRAIVE
jgi:enamine deaminase RidA (YjgF/YER057c/UK114 family)